MLKKNLPSKTPGPDGVLKGSPDAIAPMMTYIINQSFDEGLPKEWRMANVVPIFKKCVSSDPANYRPISLTCTACKIAEHIITSAIWKHFNAYNIISHNQHGGRKNFSTETLLLSCINKWNDVLDEGYSQ